MIDGRNLWELVERRATETPDDVVITDDSGRSRSFAEFARDAERAGAGIARLGIAEGDVVSWQLPTWIESAVLVAALSRLGAIQNPMLPIYRRREVEFICRQARSKLLVVPPVWRGFDYEALAHAVAAAVDHHMEVLVVDKTMPESDPWRLPPPPDPDHDPVRWYFYTSGTTADPKGAMHTDRSIMACAAGMNERLEITEDDSYAVVFPFTHIGGITWLFSALQTGCLQIFQEAFDAQGTVELIRREGVTLAGAGTPFHMAYLAAQRAQPDEPLFPSVRAYVGGGAAKPPQLHYDIKAEMGGAGVVSGYGLTEAPIITMASVNDSDEVKANTEGRATGGTRLRVVTLDGNEAGVGVTGEIRAKAPQQMRGYLDGSLDADAFDEDGWFRTGDLGFLDAAGNVTITGRVKDIIIRNMENISAKEVEDLLFSHPKVADVAVIGLPDDRTGERVCAVVVPEDAGQPLSFEVMRQHCIDQGLARQKIPEQLEIVESLPRNPTGKVLKFQLQDAYRGTATSRAEVRDTAAG